MAQLDNRSRGLPDPVRGASLLLERGVHPGLSTTTPAARSGYIPNPGMGYQGTSEHVSAYEQRVLFRRGVTDGFTWAAMNPADGVYDFAGIDAALAYVAATGIQLGFRVYTMQGESYGGHQVPQWVINAGAIILDDREPDYRSRVYLQQHARFVEAMRVRYDGNPLIAFIDIEGYGEFGQWYSTDPAPYFPIQNEAAIQAPRGLWGLDGDAHRHLVAAYAGGAGTCTALEADGVTETTFSYNYVGFQQTQLLFGANGLTGPTRHVLDNYPTVGLRNDFLGGQTFSPFQFMGGGVLTLSQRNPVLFETAPVTHDYTKINAVVGGLGASIVHDLNQFSADPQFTALLPMLGYRYVCEMVAHPTVHVARSGRFRVVSRWRNTGLAKAYPRMGQDFRLHWAALADDGAMYPLGDGGVDVSAWQPGVAQTCYALTDADHLPLGGYTLLAGVRDLRTGAFVTLAINDPSGRTDGRVPIGQFTVTP